MGIVVITVPAVRLLKIYGNRLGRFLSRRRFSCASSSSFEDLWKPIASREPFLPMPVPAVRLLKIYGNVDTSERDPLRCMCQQFVF